MTETGVRRTTFPVALLWIYGLMFIGFGVGFAAAPVELSELILDAAPSVPSALIDMRATYGGVALGIGVFFLACARRPDWVRPGLLASLLVLAALAATRIVGIVADGNPNGFMLLFLALEALSVALSATALSRR